MIMMLSLLLFACPTPPDNISKDVGSTVVKENVTEYTIREFKGELYYLVELTWIDKHGQKCTMLKNDNYSDMNVVCTPKNEF